MVELNDPSAFIKLRDQKAGGIEVTDFVGSTSNTGRTKLKTTTKKTTSSSSSSDDNYRVDDWMGGPSKAKRSWKPIEKKKKEPEPVAEPDAEPEPEPKPTPVSEPKVEEQVQQPEPSLKEEEPVAAAPVPSPAPAPAAEPSSSSSSSGAAVQLNDPSAFIKLRDAKSGAVEAVNDFVGSTSDTGRTKLEKKKWAPTKSSEDNVHRVDDWMGGSPTKARRSWKPIVKKKEPEPEPTPEPKQEPTPEPSPKEEEEPEPEPTAAAPVPAPSTESSSSSSGAAVQLNDPSAFIKLRDAKSGAVEAVTDFVGSTSDTGRTKLEKKKWAPTKSSEDNVHRVDDWMGGSPTKARRSWKPIVKKKEPEPEPTPTPDPEPQVQPEPTSKEEEEEKPATDAAATTAPSAESSSSSHVQLNDPSAFIKLRDAKSGSVEAVSDFVGSTSNTGRTKLEKKKWAPTKSSEDNEHRVDDWMGGGVKAKRSWKPIEKKKKEPEPIPEPTVATTTTTKEDESNNANSNTSEDHPEQESSSGKLNDPTKYIEMMKSKEGDDGRPDDFVGSSDNTGRVKLAKKWTPPVKSDESHRVDEWIGGSPHGGTRRSWQPKSPSLASPTMSESPSSSSRRSSEVVRKWKPPPKENAIPPPWAVSPEPKQRRSSTFAKWKPKSSPTKKKPQEGEKETIEGADSTLHTAGATTTTTTTTTTDSDSSNIHKPDPKQFIEMRDKYDSSGYRPDEFVGSNNNTGRTKIRKSWSPTPAFNNARPDDWMGSSPLGSPKRSWKVKSPSPKVEEKEKIVAQVPIAPDLDIDEPTAPATTTKTETSRPTLDKQWKSTGVISHKSTDYYNNNNNDSSDGTPDPSHPMEDSPAPAASGSTVQLNDPTAYLELMKSKEGDVGAVDDFVGASSNTGRVKVEKKKKKTWGTSASESARVDDWLGSGKTAKRSWKVKGT